MWEEIDKGKCIKNIRELMSRKHMGIGTLESNAGISQGYLSRLENSSSAKLSKDVLMRIADALDTSIEGIINYQPNERKEDLKGGILKIYEFVERLVDDTLRGKIGWDRIPNSIFKDSNSEEKPDKQMQTLIKKDFAAGSHKQLELTNFDSVFYSRYPLHTINLVEVFGCNLPVGNLIFAKLELAKGEEFLTGYELKLIRDNYDAYDGYMAEQVCWALEDSNDVFLLQLSCLCKEIDKGYNVPFLHEGVDQCINTYMNYGEYRYWQEFLSYAMQNQEFREIFGMNLPEEIDTVEYRLIGSSSDYVFCLVQPSRIITEALVRIEFGSSTKAESEFRRLWNLRGMIQVDEDDSWDYLDDKVRNKLWIILSKEMGDVDLDLLKELYPWYLKTILVLQKFLSKGNGEAEVKENMVGQSDTVLSDKNINNFEGGKIIMKTGLEAHEAMRAFVAAHGIGYVATSKEIKDWCMNNSQFRIGSAGSIIPADCCYNRVNNDPSSHIDLLFEYVARGKYRCLGDNYPYTGDVIHAPLASGGKEYVVAHWENGVRKPIQQENR